MAGQARLSYRVFSSGIQEGQANIAQGSLIRQSKSKVQLIFAFPKLNKKRQVCIYPKQYNRRKCGAEYTRRRPTRRELQKTNKDHSSLEYESAMPSCFVVLVLCLLRGVGHIVRAINLLANLQNIHSCISAKRFVSGRAGVVGRQAHDTITSLLHKTINWLLFKRKVNKHTPGRDIHKKLLYAAPVFRARLAPELYVARAFPFKSSQPDNTPHRTYLPTQKIAHHTASHVNQPRTSCQQRIPATSSRKHL